MSNFFRLFKKNFHYPTPTGVKTGLLSSLFCLLGFLADTIPVELKDDPKSYHGRVARVACFILIAGSVLLIQSCYSSRSKSNTDTNSETQALLNDSTQRRQSI